MIGLVNAAGMADVARTEVADRGVRGVVGGIFLPIKRTDDMVGFRVLRSAIEQAEFYRSSGKRKLPEGAESDRFDQAEVEAQDLTMQLGRYVDVTA